MRRFNLLFTVLLLCIVGSAEGASYDVFILAGQSNMDGRGGVGDVSGGIASPQAGSLIYYANPATSGDTTVRSGWQTLEPGYSLGPGVSRSTSSLPSSTFGPELSFVDAIAQANPVGNPVAIIKVSRGGTNLREDWSPTGFMYQGLLTEVDSALQALSDGGDTGVIRGMLWHQGESDLSDIDNYQDNLEELITNVRGQWSLPALPFLIGELDQSKDQTFRELQQDIASENAGVGFVSSAGLNTPDGTHFDAAGQVVLGQRYAEQIAILTPEPGSLVLLSLGGLMLMRRQCTCG